MNNACTYQARLPDQHGHIDYPERDHAIWQQLMERQLKILPNRACHEYLDGLERLDLPLEQIPQLGDINRVLKRASGWRVEQVPALISFDHFFKLLANRRFPVATFIRTQQDIDYLQEPDIFHEIFGHCPMLTHPKFADFTHTYGRLGLKASPQQRSYLARLYWLTVEFGLIKSDRGIRIYGGGILSSHTETRYCLDRQRKDRPLHRRFDLLDALRTPYRIDILQPVYYVIESLDTLYQLTQVDLMAAVEQARKAGLFEPLFEPAKAS